VIVVTAGHVDHGKTSLVRALTGVDTDRLAEEKRRGLSIDLGFAYADLAAPDGSTTRVGIVDVPGHQRFMHNMLAGATGSQVALLVVAADSGPMPQTREHVDVLWLLGVRRAIVALSRADRTDEPRVDTLAGALHDWLAPLFTDGLDVVATSITDGRGITALAALLATAARARDPSTGDGHLFRLAVDRAFSLAGAGTIATGFVHAGTCRIGDELRVQPGDRPARVRAIRALDVAADTTGAGERAALNLAGIERSALERGMWLCAPGSTTACQRLSARVQLLPTAPHAIDRWRSVHVHHATAHVLGRIGPVAGPIRPGAAGDVELRLEAPVVAASGDRFIVRDAAAAATLGGGEVREPLPPARVRKADIAARAAAFAAREPRSVLTALLDAGAPVDVERVRSALNVDAERVDAALAGLAAVSLDIGGHRHAVRAAAFDALTQRIEATVRGWHHSAPQQAGLRVQNLATLLDVPRGDWLAAGIRALVSSGRLVQSAGLLHVPGHRARLPPADAAAFARVEACLAAAARPPALRDLSRQLGMPGADLVALLERLARHGLLVQVSEHRYFLPSALAALARLAQSLAAMDADRRIDTQRFRDASGVGRNTAIEVLEHFDAIGLTRRRDAVRRVVRDAGDFFGAAAPDADAGTTRP
jgi:selenocysteine-specific elongation factor